MKLRLLTAFLFIATIIKAQIYVDINATGNNDGTSWTDAYTDLQSALSQTTINNNSIWIAKGTYSPGQNRTDSFNFNIAGLTVYGGFDGAETVLTERDINLNHTILSGDVNNNDAVVDFATDSNSSRIDNNHYVTQITANNVTLDGLRIEDGDAVHAGNGFIQGSAIKIASTVENPTIQNCEINNNVTYSGGAVFASHDMDTTINISNCTFNNNISRYASGLYILSNNDASLILNITNNLFSNNISKNYKTNTDGHTGSSAWIRANGANSTITSTITNCTFTNNMDIGTMNTVTERGTLSLGRNTSLNSTHNAIISNSIFYGNRGVNNTTTLAVSKGHTSEINQTLVYNSIDEDSFSNVVSKSNTSNSDPLFTDSGNNNFTLQSSSPAIDTGDNTKIPTGVSTDLLGNQRIFNTTVDMGAYEFDSPVKVQAQVYVDASASGNNDGTSWADAYTDLQSALSQRATNNIWIAKGIYSPGSSQSDSFIPQKGQNIYGGFNGTEVDLSERDMALNEVVLSGDVDNNDANELEFGNITLDDNNYRVVRIENESVLLDGITIAHGAAQGSTANGSVERQGAAIFAGYDFILRNSTLRDNFTLSDGVVMLQGQLNPSTQSAVIENCKVQNNVIGEQSVFATSSSPNAITNLNIKNTLVTNNTYRSGMFYINSARVGAFTTVTLENVTISANSTTSTISVPFIRNRTSTSSSCTFTINNSIIYQNVEPSGSFVLNGLATRDSGTNIVVGTVSATASILQGTTGITNNSTSNSSSDPMFTDSVNGDFTLQSSSPAIDAGDNNLVTSTVDLLENQRIFNTTVDMGAYEYVSSSTASIVDNEFNNTINVYPNPVKNILQISLGIGEDLKVVQVFNLIGKQVLETKRNTVNFSQLNAGIYVVKIENNSGKVAVRKVVKK